VAVEVVVYSIYRARNAPRAEALGSAADSLGWTCAMWALDAAMPEVDRWTVGSGAGTKFGILNKLLTISPPAPGAAVVVADDDVELDVHGLSTWLALSRQLEADLSQPAHEGRSHWSHGITRRRRRYRARLTNFVEIGPAFLVLPSGRHLLDDLPDDMGWGLELDWWRRWRDEGLRLAVVDAVPMRHVAAPGTDYGMADLRATTDAALRAEGFRTWRELHRTVASWPRWRSSPPTAMRVHR
jgi:hypothetical protein